jgi:hypothetical protein
MTIFSRSEMKVLCQEREEPCVSIYMPTHRVTAQIRQDRIRFRNMVRDAEKQLREYGLSRPRVEAFVKGNGGLVGGYPLLGKPERRL